MTNSFLSKIEITLFGPRPKGRIPTRVRDSIATRQRYGEILISWFQLALVLFFSALYIIAPAPEGYVTIDPVPFALGLYFLFTVAKLALSSSRGLNTPFLIASVIVDMVFLMTLIWSFHIKYDQPAAFYLKAPTLLYVFIFISLRTLRFEPRMVVVSGLAAAVGWAVLLVLALTDSYQTLIGDDNGLITRNYVQYMTSNRILIGAEIDKIITILVVTGVLAIAIVRAQRLMIRAASSASAANDLSRFVSPEVALRVTSADEEVRPGYGENKNVSIMFTDIAGFSTLSENMPPEELVGVLNDYYAALTKVVRDNGGVVNQVSGDSMLATFNAAKNNDDHARDAVRTALDIIETCQRSTFGKGTRLPTRVGINTGIVTVGAVGSQNQMWFTVYGDAVNIAARLEQLNKEHGTWIMVSEETMVEADGSFIFHHVGETVVRGRSKPTVVYTLGSVGPGET